MDCWDLNQVLRALILLELSQCWVADTWIVSSLRGVPPDKSLESFVLTTERGTPEALELRFEIYPDLHLA